MAEEFIAEGVINASLLMWLVTWLFVAGIIGWFLQSLVVIILDWRHEKSKPSP
jgi:hypothetical protein